MNKATVFKRRYELSKNQVLIAYGLAHPDKVKALKSAQVESTACTKGGCDGN